MDIENKDGPTLKMMWKMYLNKNKEFKILDVNIDGVSMLVTQRAEFLSVIKNNPNGVKGLIAEMEKKSAGILILYLVKFFSFYSRSLNIIEQINPPSVDKPTKLLSDRCDASGSMAEQIMVNIAPAAIPSINTKLPWLIESPM